MQVELQPYLFREWTTADGELAFLKHKEQGWIITNVAFGSPRFKDCPAIYEAVEVVGFPTKKALFAFVNALLVEKGSKPLDPKNCSSCWNHDYRVKNSNIVITGRAGYWYIRRCDANESQDWFSMNQMPLCFGDIQHISEHCFKTRNQAKQFVENNFEHLSTIADNPQDYPGLFLEDA